MTGTTHKNIISGDQIEIEMSGPCSTYGERRIQGSGGRSERRRPLGRPRRRWEITLEGIQKKQDGGVSWIDLAQDTEKLWAPVNTVMEIVFCKM